VTDHVRAVKTIYNKYPHIQFVSTFSLYKECEEFHKCTFDESRFEIYDFMPYTSLESPSGLSIDTFKLMHDKECRGYIIRDGEKSLCFIGDNGMYPYKLKDIPLLHKPHTYYMVESNYDMFSQYVDTKRNELLKRRVLSTKGHSDNFNAIEKVVIMLEQSHNDKCKGVMFTHLSEHCNSEDLARESHNAYIATWGKKTLFKNIKIQYAKQDNIIRM